MQIANSTGYKASAHWPQAFAAAAASPSLLRKIVRNLIESWPAEVYDRGLVEASRLGRHTVFVCDPALVRALLVDQADAIAREDFMITSLSPMLGRGILTSDGPRWKVQRRTVAPLFRPDSTVSYISAMQDAVAKTAERWVAQGPATHDILDEMMRTTLDIIGATMLPDEPALDVEAFGRSLTAYLDGVGWRIAFTMLGAPAWLPHPGSARTSRAARHLRKTVGGIVARRRAGGDTGDDLLGLMMKASDPDAAGGCPHDHAPTARMSDEALIDNLLTFVAAGHETTALAMAWTFRLLAEHPRVETRLRAEIEAAGTRPSPEALTYARQVVMEAMRLYPPAPMIVRQAVKDVRLGATVIPAGSSIHVPIYAIHRHKALWPAPETFDPDRFDPEIQRDRYTYLPFGAGPRVCIGMGFALSECITILSGLLPHVGIETLSDIRPEARFKVTLRPQGGMPMRVVPRQRAAG